MKRFAILLLLTCLLCGCAQDAPRYADDLSCSALMEQAEETIPVEYGYATFGADHLALYFEDTSLPDDYCLRYSTLSEDVNEVGIFHVTDDAHREKMEELVEGYLEELREEKIAFVASYAPQEVPKLEDARVRSFGNYVVYAILRREEQTAFFQAIEQALRE